MDTHMERQLRELLDEKEIHNVLRRYCRGVDRCDQALIASCYHDDAIDDHGNWVVCGRDAPQTIIDRVKPGSDAAMHFLGNVFIEIDGNIAYAESYILAFRHSRHDQRTVTRTRAVRFIDRFTRHGGVWKISERVVVDDWNRVDELRESVPDSDLFRYSTKNSDDPVYTIRKGQVARQPPLGQKPQQ